MKTFSERYKEIMGEARRSHATYVNVIETYKILLQSVGAFRDKQLGDDDLPLNSLTLDKTKMDAVKMQMKQEFDNTGINSDFKDNMKKDGYTNLIKIVDELDLWKDFPPAS